VGNILHGLPAAKRFRDEITLFQSFGLAIEDLAWAAFLFGKAPREGRGTWVEF
jgi:ornithine cyclodeaminase/alanine dehydrogenase-like protein (mu-crystallin family)